MKNVALGTVTAISNLIYCRNPAESRPCRLTMTDPVEELRQAALSEVRACHFAKALSLYDEALAKPSDETMQELLSINKADALIALGRYSSPEVRRLPRIVMRRKPDRHVFLAAYSLAFKYREERKLERAVFYSELALQAAQDSGDIHSQIGALNELGIIYGMTSSFAKAIECCEAAIRLLDRLEDPARRHQSRLALVANIAGNKILSGETREGLTMLQSIFDDLLGTPSVADLCIELCFGHIEIHQYDKAKHYGRMALDLATERRHICSAHYLLGEAAQQAGDIATADLHFEELTKLYPGFRNLKSFLYAIDLRSVVNFTL